MENLIKQMRVRFSGAEGENEGETSRVRDRRIPKTPSSKGENRKSQNWFKRQISNEMRRDYDDTDGVEFQTAVAAAAFAINSLEERERTRERRDGTLRKPKSKAEDGSLPVSRRTRDRTDSSLSNKMKRKEDDTVPISKPSSFSRKSSGIQGRRVSFGDQDEMVPDTTNPPTPTVANAELKDEEPRKPTDSAPSLKKTGTFADKQLDRTTSRKPKSDMPSTSRLPTEQPPPPSTEVKRKSSTEPRLEEYSKADVWERAEMERVKERYEKLIAKILEWEIERKAKAKKKLRKKEGKPEKKRARALKHYKSEMQMIDQIVEGARSQAEENRKKEEIRVKEKASKIRSTGKIPATCFCC